MGKVISFMIHKGGTGKTTITTNVASAVARKYPDKKVLIVDVDAQGNSAVSFGYNVTELDNMENTIYDCFVDGVPAKEAVIDLHKNKNKLIPQNLYLLPANDDMNFFEIDTLQDLKGRALFGFLKNTLDPIKDDYDYIFVDSPPEMKVIAGNIIKASDYIFFPFEPEQFGVLGLVKVIDRVVDLGGNIGGLFGSKIKAQTNLHKGLSIQADIFSKQRDIPILKSRIHSGIVHADAVARFGLPLVLADPHSKHCEDYYSLMGEVLEIVDERKNENGKN
jgi:chromosome partitioning protein